MTESPAGTSPVLVPTARVALATAAWTGAVHGAVRFGQGPEAASVMGRYPIAGLIEASVVDRARKAIKGLMALAPEEAEMRAASGHWKSVALADVPLGATVRVRPGGRIPLDGIVTAGAIAVHQAPLPGERTAVHNAVGAAVCGGPPSHTPPR